MKKIVLALLLISAMLSCKKKSTDSECGKMNCTYEFRSIGINYVDNKGLPAVVKDFSAVNQRTGQKVVPNVTTITTIKGSYIVIDDLNTRTLSEAGDDLKVTATSVETNQTKSVTFKVKGGKCTCHVEKVSGPELVTFD
ncbi:hypothetical protein [Pedobacter nyackensis]|uniref:hypothetical protein n=1 Tax=Pedobacter nyackensis TaxID=475255 RepID=UPI002931339C|nr:hypothetical protein [Pedobacter nyackensis]